MVVLGSTGSIGQNALKIAKRYGLEVEALVAGENFEVLNSQIEEFRPKYVVVKDKKTAQNVKFKDVKYGEDAILEVIEKSLSNVVLNAMVGDSGLRPTIKAQECSKKIALANKESLVNAGKFIDMEKITPVDSEHFALWYLLRENEDFNKLYITASGGALRDMPLAKIKNASIKEVLAHPNWDMGVKITIDSATMVNKLFEIMEAKWLFDTDKIDAFIETKSIIHALVEWKDGSLSAHISKADMKLPIAYALVDKTEDEIVKPVNLLEVGSLEFRPIDTKRYPVWELKDEVLKNPDLGVVINGANEFAIEKFLNTQIPFGAISEIIKECVKRYEAISINSLEEIFEIKKDVRKWCESYTF